MPGRDDMLSWKVTAGVAAVASTFVARRALVAVWRKVVGQEPPDQPEHPDVQWSHSIAWALVSGVTVALARMVAIRKAAEAWRRANGELPPGLAQKE